MSTAEAKAHVNGSGGGAGGSSSAAGSADVRSELDPGPRPNTSPPPQQERELRRDPFAHRVARRRNDPCSTNEFVHNVVPTEAKSLSRDQCMAQVAKINDMYKENNQEPPFPEFVFVGWQSAGKSTLFERFLGFKMNITKGGTGTRRPLQANLINGKNGRECKVRDQVVSESQLFGQVMQENKRLHQAGKFESQPFPISVKSEEAFDMILTDLPGVKGAEQLGDRDENGADIREHIKDNLMYVSSSALKPTSSQRTPLWSSWTRQ